MKTPLGAARTLLWNVQARAWDKNLLEVIGARAEQLPELHEPWAEAGRLSSEAAEAFGLPQGLPLVVGAEDDIEVIGAGVVAPGQALEHIGTTGTILVSTDTPAYDPEELVELYPNPIAGPYLLGGATNAAGRSLDWAARLLAGMGDAGRLRLDYPAPDRPEPPLYLPYIKGERGLLWSAGAKGAFCGLREEHGPADLARAAYGGVALSLKQIIAAAIALGATPQSIVSGTPLDDRSWAQRRADCYELPLRGCRRSGESVSPDPAQAAEYERRLGRYLSVARALRPTFDC